MRVSNETKVGALTVIAITIIILGFNFLRGKTIFKSGNFIYAKYADTKGLIVSNPVFVNGYQVGSVFEIENQKDNLTQIIVSVKLNEPYKIPVNSVATIQDNPLGISSISIVLGNATAFFKSGDTIKTAPANRLLGEIVNSLSPLG
jgi:phospholipid/cholesterol/gamma-HCH transport system substrate-binding protein